MKLQIENHRQGEDKMYAEMLNRIRTGSHTEEDMMLLKKHVRPKITRILKVQMYCTCLERINQLMR